ncbi:hypothetical protein ROHU_014592 [Labeo rohita]|uniref:Uncharacterized protein n=1 Tax=Labeo rohita TaxID=84645 RepID=A0A498NTL1_LABRO|nr:hypothetical protein ROHU_014592 [Labeo rohita]
MFLNGFPHLSHPDQYSFMSRSITLEVEEVFFTDALHFAASTSAAQAERQGQEEKEIDLLGTEERVGEEDSIQHAAVREPAEATDKTLATSKSSRHRGTGFNPEWLNMPQFMSWLYDTQHGIRKSL